LSLGFDDHFERFRLGGVPERLVRNQEFWVDLVSTDSLEQHRYRDGVDQSCCDGNIAVPQVLEMKIHLRSVTRPFIVRPPVVVDLARISGFAIVVRSWSVTFQVS
jgi:hypothetical protein